MVSSGRRKHCSTIVVALCAVCLLRATTVAAEEQQQQQQVPVEAKNASSSSSSRNDDAGNAELLKQVLMKKCLHRYTMTCLKLDLVRLIDRMGTARAYQLVPGVSLVRTADGNRSVTNDDGHHDHRNRKHHQYHHHGYGVPPDVVKSLVRGNESADELDGFLMEKVDAYLNSLSISVKLVDTTVVDKVRKFSGHMLASILPTGMLETGRGKKNGMQMAMWSAGTLAAISFASLAAMSGKALMTAMLALALAAACALKGHGGGGGGGGSGKTSHYEIITKPAMYEHDHVVHGAAYSSAPFSYARHLTMEAAAGGGRAYHLGAGRGPPQRVSIVHAAPAGPFIGGGHGHRSTNVDDDGLSAGPTGPDIPDSPPPPSLPPAATTGDELYADDESNENDPSSYPLSPITYIPTNNT